MVESNFSAEISKVQPRKQLGSFLTNHGECQLRLELHS